jgi:hypothetical protein
LGMPNFWADASVASLSAAHARAMAGLIHAPGGGGRGGRQRSFGGVWQGRLQCLSAEAMERPQLSDGDKVWGTHRTMR